MEQEQQLPVLREIAEHTRSLSQGIGVHAEALHALQARADAARQASEAKGWKTHTFTATVQWRLVAGLGATSVLEGAGMALHRLYGFPYLPGSSLKGLVRHYLWLNGHVNEDDPLTTQIFGSQEQRSGVIFWDALPEEWPTLEVDIINTHYQAYYSQDMQQRVTVPPADYLSPVPVYFLTVASGTMFRFSLLARKAGILEQAVGYMREAIELLGVGAKTHAGYGGMLLTEG